MMLPSPWHLEQVLMLAKLPKMLCCTRLTCPLPLQFGQRLGWLPARERVPWQAAQSAFVGKRMSAAAAV